MIGPMGEKRDTTLSKLLPYLIISGSGKETVDKYQNCIQSKLSFKINKDFLIEIELDSYLKRLIF